MVDITNAKPNVLRISIAAICLLTIFVFFDVFGLASSSIDTMANRVLPGTTSAVTHIVLFQFKKDADAAAVDETCAKMMALKDNCLAPNSDTAYIKSIRGGRDNSPEGLQHGLTHGFVVEFANTDDRNYYLDHDPAHQAFKKGIESLVESVTVLDFVNGKFQ